MLAHTRYQRKTCPGFGELVLGEDLVVGIIQRGRNYILLNTIYS